METARSAVETSPLPRAWMEHECALKIFGIDGADRRRFRHSGHRDEVSRSDRDRFDSPKSCWRRDRGLSENSVASSCAGQFCPKYVEIAIISDNCRLSLSILLCAFGFFDNPRMRCPERSPVAAIGFATLRGVSSGVKSRVSGKISSRAPGYQPPVPRPSEAVWRNPSRQR